MWSCSHAALRGGNAEGFSVHGSSRADLFRRLAAPGHDSACETDHCPCGEDQRAAALLHQQSPALDGDVCTRVPQSLADSKELSLGPRSDLARGRIQNAGEIRQREIRPGEYYAEGFCQALPVQTLIFQATSQPATPGNEAACVRVAHRVPGGSRHMDCNFVSAGLVGPPVASNQCFA